MLKRMALTHMHTCHCLKQQKRGVAGILNWVSQGQNSRNDHDFHVAVLVSLPNYVLRHPPDPNLPLIIHTRSGLGVSRRGLLSSSLGASIPIPPDRERVM